MEELLNAKSREKTLQLYCCGDEKAKAEAKRTGKKIKKKKMKTIPTVGKMIHVVWEDIFEMGAGWHSKADVDKHKPIACESIGWVHKTTDKYLTLIGDKSIDGKEKEYGRIQSIPSATITKIKILK